MARSHPSEEGDKAGPGKPAGRAKSYELVAILEADAASLQAEGFEATAHLLRMVVLDLRCRINGISVDELWRLTALLREDTHERARLLMGGKPRRN